MYPKMWYLLLVTIFNVDERRWSVCDVGMLIKFGFLIGWKESQIEFWHDHVKGLLFCQDLWQRN